MYKKWEDLMNFCDSKLLDLELEFKGINKGELTYEGELCGQKVYCQVSESMISDYDYAPKETVSSVTQSEYVYLLVGDKVVLNTH